MTESDEQDTRKNETMTDGRVRAFGRSNRLVSDTHRCTGAKDPRRRVRRIDDPAAAPTKRPLPIFTGGGAWWQAAGRRSPNRRAGSPCVEAKRARSRNMGSIESAR